MSVNRGYSTDEGRRRIGRTAGFAEQTGRFNKSVTKPQRNDGFYYYGSKKRERRRIYKWGILFLLIPIIVLFLFGNNFYLGGVLATLVGMIFSIIYLIQLLRS